MADRKSTDRASHQDIIEAAKRDHGALKEQIHVYGEPPLNSFVPPEDKKPLAHPSVNASDPKDMKSNSRVR